MVSVHETSAVLADTAPGDGVEATLDGYQDRFGERMGEVFRHWRQEMDRRLRPLGLSFAQYSVLRALERSEGGLVQKAIAEALAMEGPTLVGVLDRLAAGGLIERREAAHDRRSKLVVLMQDGRDLLARAGGEVRALRRLMLDGLPAEQIRDAERVLEHIAETFRQ